LIQLEKERYFGIPITDFGNPNSDFGKRLKVIG